MPGTRLTPLEVLERKIALLHRVAWEAEELARHQGRELAAEHLNAMGKGLANLQSELLFPPRRRRVQRDRCAP